MAQERDGVEYEMITRKRPSCVPVLGWPRGDTRRWIVEPYRYHIKEPASMFEAPDGFEWMWYRRFKDGRIAAACVMTTREAYEKVPLIRTMTRKDARAAIRKLWEDEPS